MNRPHYLAILCALLVAVSAASASDMTTGKIVFSRYTFETGGALEQINLYRVNTDAKGFRQLTPAIPFRYRWTPRWSPSGTWIAYSQFDTPTAFRYDIHVVDTAGDRHRKLTTGTGDYQFPSWSPKGNWIAFKSTEVTGKTCVALVRPDGTYQHPLFCPPTAVVQPLAPVWSKDGSCLYIAADYLDSNGYQRILAYRVPVGGGKPALLGDLGTASSDTLMYFAPGGARGLLASPGADNGLEIVNFATGNRYAVSYGYAPVWSPDAKRIAFTRTVFSQNEQTIDDAFVVNVDGTGERALTSTSTLNVHYASADWSPDSRSVLVNRTKYVPSGGGYVPSIRMYIIDAKTLVRTPLVNGLSGPGGWYKGAK
jgi:Tol biopolymer transport system component